MADKYQAVWLSHSSISDFLKCPRLYYLKNVYKDPNTGHKVKLMSPSLALGQAVHEVLESLSLLPVAQRFRQPLLEKYDQAWSKISGKKGGFFDDSTENHFRLRGQAMLTRVARVKGPLSTPAVKINMDLPHFWLSETDNIILCGKIDWLQYLPETDSVSIIDFKTSLQPEDGQSLQLPIYHLLVHYCQHHPVARAFYWYLEKSDDLEEKTLPSLTESEAKILKIGKQIKLVRQLQHFKCPTDGCQYCRPFEAILAGDAEYVGVDALNADVYIQKSVSTDIKDNSTIL